MRRILLAAAAGSALAAAARADGFRIQQGGPSVGNAGAGAAATADDPCTVFFNPAGMTELDGPQGAVVANAIRVSGRFRDVRARGSTGRTVEGGDGKDGGRTSFVPATFAVVPVEPDLALGLGVTSPFGLGGDYGDGWAGRYFATRTQLNVVDVSPCVAWRANRWLSFGAGFDLQFVDATLENAIDCGALAVRELGDGDLERGRQRARALGLAPGRDDGKAELSGDHLGLGFNAGLLWKPDDRTRIGLAYRSPVRHDIDGEARFSLPRDARRLRLARVLLDTGAKTSITLPETVNLGVVRSLGPRTDVVADLDFTRWSRFETLDVRFDNPKQPRYVEPEHWHDRVRPSLGLIHRLDDRVTLRTGVAYDQATVDEEFRRMRAPDAGRLTLAAGADFRLSDRVTLDLGFLHAWFPRATVDLRDPDAGRFHGRVRTTVDYLSLQLTVRF